MRDDSFLPVAALLAFVVLTASGCDLVFTIFEAGIWVGIIFAAFVILVIWLILRAIR